MSKPLKHDAPMKATTFRLGDKHKFALKLLARQSGQSEATVVEFLIEEAANALKLSHKWTELWDEEESVRWLSLFVLPDYRPSSVEQPLIAFVRAHPQFFYSDKARSVPNRAFAVVLWPHLKKLEQKWKRTQGNDYKAAADDMTKIIERAGLKPPANG